VSYRSKYDMYLCYHHSSSSSSSSSKLRWSSQLSVTPLLSDHRIFIDDSVVNKQSLRDNTCKQINQSVEKRPAALKDTESTNKDDSGGTEAYV